MFLMTDRHQLAHSFKKSAPTALRNKQQNWKHFRQTITKIWEVNMTGNENMTVYMMWISQ